MARAGRLSGFTGIDDPYEAPLAPDIECSTEFESTRAISSAVVANVLEYLSSRRRGQNV
jgi:adenylylsulfate kinase-like enzyme